MTMKDKHESHKDKNSKKKDDAENDEEISFDLSKITGFFKKKHENKTHLKEHENKEEKINAKKYLPILLTIILLLIPIGLSIYIRIQPNYMPVTDDWSLNSINSMLKSNIASQINSKYPNLPDSTKKDMINEELQKIQDSGVINLDGQEVQINNFVKQQSDYFKQAFTNDDNGYPYLSDLDTYYYYRLTRNYVNHGFEQDIINEKGQYCDTKILAGLPMEIKGCSTSKVSNLHVYISAWTYDIMHFFNKHIDIMRAFFFVNMIIATLAVIPAFFIGKKIAGNFGGLFTGILVAVHPMFLSRTLAGFNDTDAYNVFFPLLIFWLFTEAIFAKNNKKAALMVFLAGLAVGLYGFTWSGWFFIFAAISAAMIGYIGYLIAVNWRKIFLGEFKVLLKDDIKSSMIVLGTFIASSALFISVIVSPSVIINLFSNLISAMQIKSVGVTKIWPNVYTTVAELNPANLVTVINQISISSKILLFIGFIGLILPITHINKNKTKSTILIVSSILWYLIMISAYSSFSNSHLFYAILLSVPLVIWIIYNIISEKGADREDENVVAFAMILLAWFVVTIYASSKGMRFIMLFVPAFAIAVGTAAGIIQKSFSSWISSELNINSTLTKTVIASLLLLLLFFPVNAIKQSYDIARNEVPMMNDQWYQTLQKINREAAPDAIINSWWDFGHWFIAIGNRSVTLDGGRQNNPAAHWLGQLMLTSDENESVGILRYLDCGNNYGFEVLDSYNKDELKSIIELKKIITIADKEKAEEILRSYGIPKDNVTEILKYTHCNPPEDYFITSEDMVGKSGVWAHFGAWNFTRATMFNKVHDKNEEEDIKILKNEFDLNNSEAERIYGEIQSQDPDQWIAPWPGYAGETKGTLVNNNTITCGNGITFNLDTKDASVNTAQGIMHPAGVSFINKEGEFEITRYNNNVLKAQNGREIGTAIVPISKDQYNCVLMDNYLTSSIFTRLFYFENVDNGLKHFKKFYQVTDITGQKIIVWKIDWTSQDV
jgi:dolichyl-diphosphooligosaccharide--protein glycosyltransferase